MDKKLNKDIKEESNIINGEEQIYNNKNINKKERKKISKSKKNRNKTIKKINKIKKESIIDTINIDQNFNFNRYNYIYTLEKENIITEYTKKHETNKTIYLVCKKRGNNRKNVLGRQNMKKKQEN